MVKVEVIASSGTGSIGPFTMNITEADGIRKFSCPKDSNNSLTLKWTTGRAGLEFDRDDYMVLWTNFDPIKSSFVVNFS
jgi:hypothetical protein